MPPPYDHPSFQLRLLQNPYSVIQLKHDEAIPPKYIGALMRADETSPTSEVRMVSITRTKEEISIVSEVEEGSDGDIDAQWRCIKIAGPMAFDVVGVICNFTAPIKAAGVGVFAVSTWNTDYVLVPREHVEKAVDALKKDGWRFDE